MEGEVTECKLVIVGDARCGKTALVLRFTTGTFDEVYSPTGFDKHTATVSVGDSRINFTVWDTSGNQSYDSVRPLAYQDAKVFLLCFKVNDPDSLDNAVNKWYPEIREHCSPSTPVILCACQSDTRNDMDTISSLAKIRRIPVTSEQALSVSRQLGASTYLETSAKTSISTIQDVFHVAALAALGKLNKKQSKQQPIKNKLGLKAGLKGRAKSCSLM